MASSPILDLSYRNYDGPLEAPAARWWAIAKMTMRLGVKKRGFWLWAVLSGYWYLVLMAVFYFTEVFLPTPQQAEQFFARIVWKDQFLNAFSIGQLVYFIIALLIGIGTIANDNRANALLIYLSKPCTKLDYIIGKWLGIFVPLTLVVAGPTLLFYLYGVLSYRHYGFLSQDPWLIVRLLFMCTIPGIFHASLALGISSFFNQGRMAGATYSGVYFLGLFFTKAMQVIHTVSAINGAASPKIVETLYYFAPDGLQIAMAKIILGTDGSPLFPGLGGPRGRLPNPIHAPNAALFALLFFGICAMFVLIAWRRVRAVEVVG